MLESKLEQEIASRLEQAIASVGRFDVLLNRIRAAGNSLNGILTKSTLALLTDAEKAIISERLESQFYREYKLFKSRAGYYRRRLLFDNLP